MSCDPNRALGLYCYESCRVRKGSCHPCDWTTCSDDVGFIRVLLQFLETQLCLDTRRIYAYGCSNGGMFVHELVQSLPSTFAAVAAGCGGKPHRGWEEDLPKRGLPVSMLLMTGRSDHTIPSFTPPPNTSWWDGYLYADESAVIAAYRTYNACTNSASRWYKTPRSGKNLVCEEEGYDCAGGSSVVRCAFDGGHDLLLATGTDEIADGPQLVWRFFSAHAQSMPAESSASEAAGDATQNHEGFDNTIAALSVIWAIVCLGVSACLCVKGVRAYRRPYARHTDDSPAVTTLGRTGMGGSSSPSERM